MNNKVRKLTSKEKKHFIREVKKARKMALKREKNQGGDHHGQENE